MARAYLCIARNDLPSIGDAAEAGLQINDLKPYSSEALRNYVGYGQTGVWAFLCSFAAVASPANGGGIRTTAVNYYNLTGYLLDPIHSDPTAAGPAPNNCTLSDANALALAAWCAGRVAGGLPLTAALFNAACLAQVGGATGIGVGNSTATLEQILRILTGEIYCLPAGAISGAGAVPAATQGGAFLATAQGYFVTAPNVQVGTDVRGRKISQPVGWGTAVQVAPQNIHWRDVRVLYNTGELHRSIVNGQLSKVLPDTWAWTNPTFTYGGGATPAQDIAGTNIAAGGASRACTVYDAAGNVL